MHEVIPAILAKTEKELVDGIKMLEPLVSSVHIDIADGKFVDNTTIKGYEELNKMQTDLKIGIHLMMEDPYSQMFNWYAIGGIWKFIVHVECRNGLKELIEQIKLNNKEVWLAFNPQTRLDDIEQFLDIIDGIQIMTVEPGAQGKPYLPEVLWKISAFRERFSEKPIAVDGGMDPKHAREAMLAGASVIISGSYIMKSKDPEKAINALKFL